VVEFEYDLKPGMCETKWGGHGVPPLQVGPR
jgi:hypothetical protein